jgi:hypothetical protein
MITSLVSSIFLPLYFLSFFDLCLMITSLVSSIFLPLYFLSFDLCLNEVIIRHRSKKDRKYNDKMIEDTNGGIIRHRSKDRKYNDKMIEDTNEVIIRL